MIVSKTTEELIEINTRVSDYISNIALLRKEGLEFDVVSIHIMFQNMAAIAEVEMTQVIDVLLPSQKYRLGAMVKECTTVSMEDILQCSYIRDENNVVTISTKSIKHSIMLILKNRLADTVIIERVLECLDNHVDGELVDCKTIYDYIVAQSLTEFILECNIMLDVETLDNILSKRITQPKAVKKTTKKK